MSQGSEPDPYTILGVDRDATISQIKSARNKLFLQCHPDKVIDKSKHAAASERFREVEKAYALLSDGIRRSLYDARYVRESAAPSSNDFDTPMTDTGPYFSPFDAYARFFCSGEAPTSAQGSNPNLFDTNSSMPLYEDTTRHGRYQGERFFDDNFNHSQYEHFFDKDNSQNQPFHGSRTSTRQSYFRSRFGNTTNRTQNGNLSDDTKNKSTPLFGNSARTTQYESLSSENVNRPQRRHQSSSVHPNNQSTCVSDYRTPQDMNFPGASLHNHMAPWDLRCRLCCDGPSGHPF